MKRFDWNYRLRRRASEVSEVIKLFRGGEASSILDVGTADGLMLNLLSKRCYIRFCVGIERSLPLLIKVNKQVGFFVNSDALDIPLADEAFDVVIAAALIEHLPDVKKVMMEFHRVLKDDGLCIITTPHPFWEWIGAKTGYEDEDEHAFTFTIPELVGLMESCKFKVVLTKNFMVSPFGLPFEDTVEGMLNKLGLGSLMCNQLAVGRK
jgi:ubiquinone/menaquinone biosynthesis C-methylase UbiE